MRHICSRPLLSLLVIGLLVLSGTTELRADVFTVGPAGTHASIQAGVDAARAVPGDHQVRVQKGAYEERVVIESVEGTLLVSGGWDASFSVHDREAPSETIVDARGEGRPLTVECSEGRIQLSFLTFTGGYVTDPSSFGGGGVSASLLGTCTLALIADLITENRVELSGDVPFPPRGGGISAYAVGSSRLEVRSTTISANEVVSDRGSSFAGGGSFLFGASATLELRDVELSGNAAEAASGGFDLITDIDARARVVDTSVFDNRLSSPDSTGSGSGARIRSRDCDACDIEIRRLEVRYNRGEGEAAQIYLLASPDSRIEMTDSLVARGDAQGVDVDARRGGGGGLLTAGELLLTNLAVVDHPGVGLHVADTDRTNAKIHNTLLFGNGTNLAGISSLGPSNLVGVDPLFVDRAGGDYHLGIGSPAIDAGDDFPPGGLGPSDLDRRARVRGRHVDVGAYEARSDLCHVERHGTLGFVHESAPICGCLQSDFLRQFQCGFTFPDLFIDVEIPWPIFPGEEISAGWALHPWGPVDGPYWIQASLVIGGQEIPLEDSKGGGKLEGKAREGKDIETAFELRVPAAPSALRIRLFHFPEGADEPLESVTDVLLVAAGEGKQQ